MITRMLSEEDPAFYAIKQKAIRLTPNEQSLLDGDDPMSALKVVRDETAAAFRKQLYQRSQYGHTAQSDFLLPDELELQIHYSFSGRSRPRSLRYGNPKWSARFLYEYLCAVYNNGRYFIDDYLMILPTRPVYATHKRIQKTLNDQLRKRYNSYGERGPYGKQWASWRVFQDSAVAGAKAELAEYGGLIRQDIINCLKNGIIPLAKTGLAPSTIQKRLSLGYGALSVFAASGWLIAQLTIWVTLDNNPPIVLRDSAAHAKAAKGA